MVGDKSHRRFLAERQWSGMASRGVTWHHNLNSNAVCSITPLSSYRALNCLYIGRLPAESSRFDRKWWHFKVQQVCISLDVFFSHFTPLLINLIWVLTSFRRIMATYLVSQFHNLSLHDYNKQTWTFLELKKCWPLPVFLHNTPVLLVKNYWCILYNVKYRSERIRLVQALSEELTFLFYTKVASCWCFRSVKVLSCWSVRNRHQEQLGFYNYSAANVDWQWFLSE